MRWSAEIRDVMALESGLAVGWLRRQIDRWADKIGVVNFGERGHAASIQCNVKRCPPRFCDVPFLINGSSHWRRGALRFRNINLHTERASESQWDPERMNMN